MTAMCDVAFLLLTFFMLTSNFTKKEPVLVATPSSVSEIKIPETNIMTILIDSEGKIYFGIDGQANRQQLIGKMAAVYRVALTEEEIKRFTLLDLFGNPMSALKPFLSLPSERRDLNQNNMGIPADSTNNQFKEWIKSARSVNPDLRIAIKADEKTPYPAIKKVMKSLQELDENHYNLITRLETAPEN